MIAIADSTVIFHLNRQYDEMMQIIKKQGITELFITRIGYLEILGGASENAKLSVRKMLHQYPVLEFDKNAVAVSNTLVMKYRVGARSSKDFLIACIAISNKLPLLTENNKDFNFAELKMLTYRIK